MPLQPSTFQCHHLLWVLLLGQIDVIYIGTYDLSQSLGVPDDVDSPIVTNAVEKCVKKIRDNGIAAGVLAQSEEDIEKPVPDKKWEIPDTEPTKEEFEKAKKRLLN